MPLTPVAAGGHAGIGTAALARGLEKDPRQRLQAIGEARTALECPAGDDSLRT